MEPKCSHVRWTSLLRIAASLLLLVLLYTACAPAGQAPEGDDSGGSPPSTQPPAATSTEPPAPQEKPTMEPAKPMQTNCPFSNSYKDEEYFLWTQSGDCTRGVVVAMPVTLEDDYPVDLEWTTEVDSTEEFKVIRRIANVEVLDRDGNMVSEFGDPPVRLYLAVTEADIQQVMEDFNRLAFAYLNEKTNAWVRFTTDANGYALLRYNGDYIYFWTGNEWIVLTPDNGNLYFNNQVVRVDQLIAAFDALGKIQDFRALAFVYISGWGDRHIAAGE